MTKTRITIVAAILALCGCAKETTDQQADLRRGELRRAYFVECMKLLPPGPAQTKFNDWSEVIDSCNSHSNYLLATTCPYGSECRWKPETAEPTP